MNPQALVDNFSTHLKSTIARSISLAAYLQVDAVDPVHLLAALTHEEGAVGAEILKRLEMTHETVLPLIAAEENIELKQLQSISGSSNLPELSEQTRTVLEKALLLAYDRSHNYIGTEHLLHGLITSGNDDIRHVFVAHKIEYKEVEGFVETALQNTSKFSDIDNMQGVFEGMQDEHSQNNTSIMPFTGSGTKQKKSNTALNQFTVNLTHKKQTEQLDPVIGREHEIERIINTLARRNKNNPILVGEPGVGKTAIVEGLAKRIAEGNVPELLKRKKIISLDLTLLIAGTIYRGEFESRLKQIMDEIAENDQYILFIDELHNIIGAGSNQGTLDAANILKPALARGQLRCIGATTYDEYKKYIASDPALERRFEVIHVEEPSIDETTQILTGLSQYYESFHSVSITKAAIEKAVELSSKYIHDKYQPDKSIDIIDEAAARVRSRHKTSTLAQKYHKLLKQKETYEEKKAQAIEQEELRRALQWKKKLERIEQKITTLEAQLQTEKKAKQGRVGAKDVAETVSNKFGINLDIVLSNEWDQLQTLEKRLKKHIVGQDEALGTVVQELQQSYIGITRTNKPFASFLFVGPSGVGKTELAKVLATELYHDPKALIKLDMSEFSESHSISKLLGAPAGYVGFKERNRFLDEINKRPYSVIVFDEFDKAHPDVRKLLLQMLDEGYVTDSGGKQIQLKHAIIILTSNVGADLFKSSGIGFGGTGTTEQNKIETHVKQQLKEELGSSLLSRLDRTILFHPLATTDIAKIVKKHVQIINEQLKNNHNISIKLHKSAVDSIISEYYNQDLGARNIPTSIDHILNNLVIDVIKNKPQEGALTLSHKSSGYTLS